MPQLDPITFFSQIVWFISLFLVYYFFMLRFYLPSISLILKLRQLVLISERLTLNGFYEQIIYSTLFLQEYYYFFLKQVTLIVTHLLNLFRNLFLFFLLENTVSHISSLVNEFMVLYVAKYNTFYMNKIK